MQPVSYISYAMMLSAPQEQLDAVPSALVYMFLQKAKDYLRLAVERDSEYIPDCLAEVGFWSDQFDRYDEHHCPECGAHMEDDDDGFWCIFCFDSEESN